MALDDPVKKEIFRVILIVDTSYTIIVSLLLEQAAATKALLVG
jgi:hypothetical protein